jgi:hypothetical protein
MLLKSTEFSTVVLVRNVCEIMFFLRTSPLVLYYNMHALVSTKL